MPSTATAEEHIKDTTNDMSQTKTHQKVAVSTNHIRQQTMWIMLEVLN